MTKEVTNAKSHLVWLPRVGMIIGMIFLSMALLVAKPFVVVLDAGHGGKDPGALGRRIKEKDIALSVALKVGKELVQRDKEIKVLYTRKSDVFVNLYERANIGNRAGADVFVSIHANAAANRSAYGTETFILGLANSDEQMEVAKRENAVILLEDDHKAQYKDFNPTSTDDYIIFEMQHAAHTDQSVELASLIQHEFKYRCKRHDRGVRQAGFVVLRKAARRSVLVELGFVSNAKEEQYLASDKGRAQLANGIVNGVLALKHNLDRTTVGGDLPLRVAPRATMPESEAAGLAAKDSKKLYRVQIYSDTRKLRASSPLRKRHKDLIEYKYKGRYCYAVGKSFSQSEMSTYAKQLRRRYRGAFLVVFDGTKRVR